MFIVATADGQRPRALQVQNHEGWTSLTMTFFHSSSRTMHGGMGRVSDLEELVVADRYRQPSESECQEDGRQPEGSFCLSDHVSTGRGVEYQTRTCPRLSLDNGHWQVVNPLPQNKNRHELDICSRVWGAPVVWAVIASVRQRYKRNTA